MTKHKHGRSGKNCSGQYWVLMAWNGMEWNDVAQKGLDNELSSSTKCSSRSEDTYVVVCSFPVLEGKQQGSISSY
jgi:hypothetical protein